MFGASLLPGVTVGRALGLDGMIRQPRGPEWQKVAREHTTREPAPTVPAGSRSGGGDTLLYLQSHADPRQSIHAPCPALPSSKAGHYAVHPYRWSDAMLEKHPPASPASPAPTVQAKWFKGGAEGLLDVTSMMGEPATWKRKGELWVRRLTPLECLRLQSGPDDFRWPDGISKTQKYKIVGNGVACRHGYALSKALAIADPVSKTVISLFCGGGLLDCGMHGRFWTYEPVGVL